MGEPEGSQPDGRGDHPSAHSAGADAVCAGKNVFLGDAGRWRRDAVYRERFAQLCERVGYTLDTDALVSDLSIGERQMVAIFQALGTGAELIVMDKPTASLANEDREIVYQTVRHLSRVEGRAILFVSHFLDEVIALTDCVTVLRDGVVVMHADTLELDESRIAEAIAGRVIVALERAAPPHDADAPQLLEVEALASPGKLASPVARGAGGRSDRHRGAAQLGTQRTAARDLRRGPVRHRRCAREWQADPPLDRRGGRGGHRAGAGEPQGLVPLFEIWRNTTLPALEGVS